MSSMGVEIDRRGGHLLRVDRNGLALWRVLRTEVVADGQAREAVLEMDDQRFAGKYVQRRRRIEIATRPLPVRRRASDHLIVEKEKVLDRRGYRIEGGLALSRGEPNFKNAFLARQRYRLSELRSNRRTCSPLDSLRPRSYLGTFKRPQHSKSTDCQRAKQLTCTERVVE